MNLLGLDTEHSSNVFGPWEEGFYLTCVGVVTDVDGERKNDIIWFDHRDQEATVDGIQKIQDYIARS